jgi:hypothetical protein
VRFLADDAHYLVGYLWIETEADDVLLLVSFILELRFPQDDVPASVA